MGGDNSDDEGGFDVNLPPNRYRTRSVAIVAGYTPERLYSNVPSGSSWRQQRVVESGVYKVWLSVPRKPRSARDKRWFHLIFVGIGVSSAARADILATVGVRQRGLHSAPQTISSPATIRQQTGQLPYAQVTVHNVIGSFNRLSIFRHFQDVICYMTT